MNFQDAQKALCRKLDISYNSISQNGLFSLDDIKGYLNDAGREVWDYRFWDFAEGSKELTIISTDLTNQWVPYPFQFVSGTLFYLRINGKEQTKKRFQDFLKLFEDSSTATDKYWAEHKRRIFFNPNNVALGNTFELYGKNVYTALSADADLMPFGDEDNTLGEQSLNAAVVQLAYSIALGSEKKKNESASNIERQKAFIIIDSAWATQVSGQVAEQPRNRPMFNVPDFYSGNRGGRSYNIGRFGND